MNGRERILAMLDGGQPDRLPLMPITMMFAGDLAGIRYRDYATDAEALAEAQIKVAETFEFDYVSAISDPAREASDLGAAIEWFDNQPPAIVEEQALLQDKSALAGLKAPDPRVAPRMADRVRAVSLLKRRAGGERLVEGWIEGPCAMAADLRGLNRLMFDFTDDPEFVQALFRFAVEMEVRFAEAQIASGADLIGIGDAASSLVGPKIFRDFVAPMQRELVARVKRAGGRTRLHICGNTRRVLPEIAANGADIVDLDYPVPVADARAAMGPDQVLLGNIDPVRVLRDGTPETIESALEACRQAAKPRYIVGAGCEIPRGTPDENVRAMTEFARSH